MSEGYNYPDNLYRDALAKTASIARDPSLKDDLPSIMADLRSDLGRAYENAKCRIDAVQSKRALADLAQEAQKLGFYDDLPNEGTIAPNPVAAIVLLIMAIWRLAVARS